MKPANSPIRILLVDDHALFRKGIASLLGSEPDFEVVGEAASGREAVERARELMPDVILMDVFMPGGSGPEATARIKEILPYVRIVMLTISEEDEDLFEAVKSGAQGYLLKKIEPQALFGTLRGVMQGEAPISRMMAGKILGEFSRLAKEPAAPAKGASLTPREHEVLELITQGKSNKEIASALSMAENTVKNHLKNILEKLHLENRVQAATFALRQGLVGKPRRDS
ncbi:MAG: response regulator [Candidatus Methylomirabilales bacterium]